jgi:hypothetical protein
MVQNRVLYTDGRHVTITDTEFQVNKMAYQLRGITKHGLHIIKPFRLPGFLLLLVGAFLIVGSLLGVLPRNLVSPVEAFGVVFTSNDIMIGIGAFIVLISILVIGLLRERYAVRIATAEGEKDVVVSKQREYISQIISALNKAFNFVRGKKDEI